MHCCLRPSKYCWTRCLASSSKLSCLYSSLRRDFACCSPSLVSLEYYVTFHDFFKTICFNHVETALPYARQKLTGFVNEEKNWGKSWWHEKINNYIIQEKHKEKKFWKKNKVGNIHQIMQTFLLQTFMKICINFLMKMFNMINYFLIQYKRIRALESEFTQSPRWWWRVWSRVLHHEHFGISGCDWKS